MGSYFRQLDHCGISRCEGSGQGYKKLLERIFQVPRMSTKPNGSCWIQLVPGWAAMGVGLRQDLIQLREVRRMGCTSERTVLMSATRASALHLPRWARRAAKSVFVFRGKRKSHLI